MNVALSGKKRWERGHLQKHPISWTVEDTPLAGNESPLGGNPSGIKGIVSSSPYVCGGHNRMATNGLILLENVEENIHFQQIFADTAMGGEPSPVLQFFPT